VLGGVAALACSTPLTAQTILGRVLDASNDRPVSLAAVHLMDGGRNTIVVAMADSLGRYALTLPDSGSYLLVAQRFGYHDMESPLLSLSDARDYTLDLELRPEPLGLGEITVTVRNEQAIRWLTREFGINPSGLFGFRILQGERLATAKAKGRSKPTETLRWLYVPVAHGMECVSINTTPRAVRGGWRGPRPGTSDDPGSAPVGTVSIEALRSGAEEDSDGCGRLLLNDRVVPNEHLDGIDMATIAVIVTLPGVVRMYTYDFDWTFR
jgi:hypothetical protein